MLAPASFTPNWKNFDQLLQMVRNKTTVLMLFFRKLLQTSTRPLISVHYAKVCHDFLLKKICLTVAKIFVEEPVFVSENFGYRETLCLRGEFKDFLYKCCCLTVPKIFLGNPSLFHKFSRVEEFYGLERGGGRIKIFRRVFLCRSADKRLCFERFLLSKSYRKIYAL